MLKYRQRTEKLVPSFDKDIVWVVFLGYRIYQLDINIDIDNEL